MLGQVAEKKAEVEREKHQLELTLDVTRNKFLQLDMIIQVAACMYVYLHMYMYVYRYVCMEQPPGKGNLTPQLYTHNRRVRASDLKVLWNRVLVAPVVVLRTECLPSGPIQPEMRMSARSLCFLCDLPFAIRSSRSRSASEP
jgi:hypothetical protein